MITRRLRQKKWTRRLKGGGDKELLAAVSSGDFEKVKDEIEKGANVNAIDHHGDTALMEASLLKDGLNIATFLIEKGANVNAANRRGYTALMFASLKGRLNIVRLLIENGADVNALNANGERPLLFASWQGHRDIVTLLIEKGAKPLGVIEEQEPRDIIEGSENAITYDEIQDGDLMLNFPRNNRGTEYTYGSYYKNSANIRALRKNPHTRRNLKNSNFKLYKAHVVSKQSENKQSENKQSGNKQSENKQSENKQSENKQSENKQSGNKQSENKQSENKQSGNKQSENKQSENKQSGNKQSENKQSGNKQGGRRANAY